MLNNHKNSKIFRIPKNNIFRDKRAQGKLIILILAIGIFIVSYLVVLPLDERCNLLPDLPECVSPAALITLLNVSPSWLVPQEVADYSFQPIELFSYESLDFPISVLPQRVERSWWYGKSIEEKFTLHEKVKNAKVFVSVSKSSGFLDIFVNGKKIKTVDGNGQFFASIPKSILNKTNTLRVAASIPYVPWWVNNFEIDSLVVKEIYLITQDTITENIALEKNVEDVKSAVLSFSSECFTQDPLQIVFNGKVIDDRIICDDYAVNLTQYLAKDNNLTFYTKGNYLLEKIKFDIETRGKDYPSYYFNIDEDQVKSINNRTSNAALYLFFPNLEQKQADIYLNGAKLEMSTASSEYRTLVNQYVREGQNSIMIVPKKAFVLTSLILQIE
jgi:hypothetical protein